MGGQPAVVLPAEYYLGLPRRTLASLCRWRGNPTSGRGIRAVEVLVRPIVESFLCYGPLQPARLSFSRQSIVSPACSHSDKSSPIYGYHCRPSTENANGSHYPQCGDPTEDIPGHPSNAPEADSTASGTLKKRSQNTNKHCVPCCSFNSARTQQFAHRL